MIRLFSTQFQLGYHHSLEDLVEVGKKWVSGSHWSIFKAEDFLNLKNHGDRTRKDEYSFEIGKVKSGDLDLIGMRYINPGYEGDKFYTTIVGSKSETEFLVSVNLEYDSPGAKIKGPFIKKPYIVKMLINSLGGGRDGDILVSDKPILLNEGEEAFVGDILRGLPGAIMPVLYLSTDNNGCIMLDSSKLSNDLSGIANVLVEPSRSFSFKLREIMKGKNVYGGAIGVYWPDGLGRYFWRPEDLEKENSERDIYDKIVFALNSRRLRRDLIWDNIQSIHNTAIIKEMKESHTKDVDTLFELYETESKNKDKQIHDLEERLGKINAELRRVKSSTAFEQGLIEDPQIVQLFKGEVRQIIYDCVKQCYNSLPNGTTRRKQVLNSVLETNIIEDKRKEIEDKIKRMFNDYTGLTGKMRSELKHMGFSISEEGKHYKLYMEGQEGGISVAVPKTPSDYRAGKNVASEILRVFF